MKKQHKGIFFVIIFGGGLLFWATAASIPGIMPTGTESKIDPEITITGTPADNFPDAQRAQFCSSGNAKSGTFVKEYRIPTECTQPLAIKADPDGNIWFAQTNTGNLAKFNPTTETFTEFPNELWPEKARSMIWGMDYGPDGSLWYTDENFDTVWKFSISDEKYDVISYPKTETPEGQADSLPQKIEFVGSHVVVNDFTGNKLTFFDPSQAADRDELTYLSVPSPVENSFTGDFAVDSEDNVWYTNWAFQQGGVLIKFDHPKYLEENAKNPEEILSLGDFTQAFTLPGTMSTPNGLAYGNDGNLWIAETSSSNFYKFDTNTEEFSTFITSDPHPTTYGNATGMVKAPVTRPYWIANDDNGNLVFNQQTANRLAIFEPISETLTEYLIPSKNPDWADCERPSADCGLAQVFGFTANGDKIWFTEWVENNIGYVDTSIPVPFSIDVEKSDITLQQGETIEFNMIVTPNTDSDIQNVSFVTSDTGNSINLYVDSDTDNFQLDADAPQVIRVSITADDNALALTYKVLLGAQTDEITISKFVTVKIIR